MRALAAGLVVLAGVAGCGDDDATDSGGPLVGEIATAVDALEDALGEGVEFFEINADALKVTLWVAEDDATMAVPYVWAAGEISDPQDGQEAEGNTFTAAEGLTFDADRVLDMVIDDFGDRVESFSVVGAPGTRVRFSAVVLSARGGRLEVALGPNGEILEAGAIG